jgi:hypothetical protein
MLQISHRSREHTSGHVTLLVLVCIRLPLLDIEQINVLLDEQVQGFGSLMKAETTIAVTFVVAVLQTAILTGVVFYIKRKKPAPAAGYDFFCMSR